MQAKPLTRLRHHFWSYTRYRLISQQVWQEQQWDQPVIGKDTSIRIYNCTARKQVPLVLRNTSYATWYTCGPTVYDSTHLGHASCYVKLDIIQRILRHHFHINLITAMNITDIDDKIIKRSQECGKDWRQLSRAYENEFWTDLNKLNVLPPNVKVRVTEYMQDIVAFIERIIASGNAYIGGNNSVYFAVNKCVNYGKLQKTNLEATANETSVEGKQSPADFALWKAQKSSSEPAWPSPWGAGRPGWHIECSTLASMIFGGNLDFHAGGLDLRFPHHENEEAQSCAYHNTRQWVNYWLHTGQLNMKGQTVKMSKSLKNTVSVSDMLKHYTADDFRMACALSNYRNTVEYSDELMQTSSNTLKRFKSFITDCEAYMSGKKRGTDMNGSEIFLNIQRVEEQVDTCYKNDFNTARAIGVLLEQVNNLSRSINSDDTVAIGGSCLDAVAAVNNVTERHLRILGFAFVENAKTIQMVGDADAFDMNGLVEDLLQLRSLIRERAGHSKRKDLFQICDELRNCLGQHGIAIRDHSQGTSWQFSKSEK